MTPGWYLITQTSPRCYRLKGYAEAEARAALAAAKPAKNRVIQLVKFNTHFTWCVVEEKR